MTYSVIVALKMRVQVRKEALDRGAGVHDAHMRE